MGIGAAIGSVLGQGAGPLLDGAAKIINAIKGHSPEDAVKIQELLTRHEDAIIEAQTKLELAQREENVRLNQIASDNIKADAQSNDKFQARARPGVIWLGMLMLLWNYCVLPFAGLHWHLSPVTLPDMFWWTWGTVVTGVVFTRSFDKVMGGAGGSVNMPMGMKIESKGD